MLTLHFSTRSHLQERGFTLVEIMVAMVIGMLGIIIMMQMSSTFESQKRTTTGGDDALNAGAIALFGLQQSAQQAGYCFASASSAAVPSPTLSWTGATLSPVKLNYAPISTSTISDNPNNNTVMVAYGNDSCVPESASGVASAANTIKVLAYAVFGGNLMQCDYVLSDCALAASWAPIAGDVVSLKAECTSSSTVRIALVVRNHQLIKPVIDASGTHHATGVPPQDYSATPTWSGTSAINLALVPVDTGGFTWQDYRYKTFQTLVPIRNSDWTGATGCQ